MNTVVVYRAGNTVTTFRSERAFGVAAARVSLETFSHHPTETTSLDAQSRARAGGDMTEGLALEREGDALLTSGLWNRRRDLRAVRRHLGTEFGSDPADVEVRCARTDAVLATGYRRVLLGDHGPYLELDPEAVRWENLRRVHAGDARFYDEWRVAVGRGGGDDAVSTPENARSRSARADDDVAKLYHQIKPVTGQRNPPARHRVGGRQQQTRSRGVRRVRPRPRVRRRLRRARAGPGHADAARRGGGGRRRRGPRDYAQRGAGRLVAPLGRARRDRARGRHGPAQRRGWGLGPGQSARKRRNRRVPGRPRVRRRRAGSRRRRLVRGIARRGRPGRQYYGRQYRRYRSQKRNPVGWAAFRSGGAPPRRARDGPRGRAATPRVPGLRRGGGGGGRRGSPGLAGGGGEEGGGTPAARAAERAAMVPWARRAEAERRATASAMRRVARILRDNCARIVAERGARTRRLSTNEAPINGRAPKASLPAWLAATGRGAVVCPVLETCVGALNLAARAAGETVAGNGGRAEGGSAAGSASASAAELTEEGLRGLRRRAAGVAGLGVRGVRGVRGREDERRDGNEEDEEDEEDEDETVSASLRAFDDVLPAAGVGDGPLVVVLPAANRRASTRDDSSKKNAGGGGGLGHRAALALRASPRCVGVVLVSEGPDAAVKDAVALAGACAFGTEPFVPTSARAQRRPTSRRRR